MFDFVFQERQMEVFSIIIHTALIHTVKSQYLESVKLNVIIKVWHVPFDMCTVFQVF